MSFARRKLAESFGEPLRELPSLAEAKQFSDGVVVMEREGTILLVARAQPLRCSARQLEELARELGAELSYERHAVEEPIFGGGGARVTMEPWVDASLDAARIVALLTSR